MVMIDWYLAVLKNYVGFTGRAGRPEFWWFTLVNTIAYFVLFAIDMVVGTMVLAMIYSVAVLIPSWAVAFRRMHDIGKSAWWLLVVLIPFVGLFVLIYFFVLPSNPEENQFGPVPPSEPTK